MHGAPYYRAVPTGAGDQRIRPQRRFSVVQETPVTACTTCTYAQVGAPMDDVTGVSYYTRDAETLILLPGV